MATVIQIRLSLSNSFLVVGERAILIDTGSPQDGKKLRRNLAKHGVQDLALILHTHGLLVRRGPSQVELPQILHAVEVLKRPTSVKGCWATTLTSVM